MQSPRQAYLDGNCPNCRRPDSIFRTGETDKVEGEVVCSWWKCRDCGFTFMATYALVSFTQTNLK